MKKKRILAVILAVLFILLLSGCTKQGNCELCGEYATLHRIKRHGVSVWLCDSCYDAAKALSFIFD